MLRPKDILLVGLALSSGALGIVAWRQQIELRRLAALVQADGLRAGAPVVQLHTASQRRLPVLAPRRAEPEPATDTHSAEIEAQRQASVDNAKSRRKGALVRLLENPEFVQALGRQHYAMLDSRFAELFRRLKLRDDELNTFKSLLAEKENIALDVVTVNATSPAGPLLPEALRASVRAAQSQVEQSILSALGSERYAIYRDYEQTLPQRAVVGQLEQRLSYTAAPLAPHQAESLVQILAASTPTRGSDTLPALSVLVRSDVPEAVPLLPTSTAVGRVTDEAVAQAQTVLAPAQVQALRELQSEQQAALRTAELVREHAPRDELHWLGLPPILQ